MNEYKRIFTLREAQALVPTVRDITMAAVVRAERLAARIEDLSPGEPRMLLETQYNALVRGWASQITELGCEVKGLWLVDFDSGDGIYYCWHHPEETLEYFHHYDTGFADRRPLGPLMVS